MSKIPDIRVRGVRQTVPSGYVMGRASPGAGAAELIPMSTLGQKLVTTGQVGGPGAVGSPENPAFEFLGFSAEGPFGALQQFPLSITPHDVQFPSAAGGATKSLAVAEFPPSADTSFVLTDDLNAYLSAGTHVICTVAFAAGAKTGTLTYGTTALVTFGTVLWIVFPLSPDAALGGVQALFCGDAQ